MRRLQSQKRSICALIFCDEVKALVERKSDADTSFLAGNSILAHLERDSERSSLRVDSGVSRAFTVAARV